MVLTKGARLVLLKNSSNNSRILLKNIFPITQAAFWMKDKLRWPGFYSTLQFVFAPSLHPSSVTLLKPWTTFNYSLCLRHIHMHSQTCMPRSFPCVRMSSLHFGLSYLPPLPTQITTTSAIKLLPTDLKKSCKMLTFSVHRVYFCPCDAWCIKGSQ